MRTQQLIESAAKGDAKAQYTLGNLYQYGKDNFPESKATALVYYQLAASQNYVLAAKSLQLLAMHNIT